MEDTQPHHWITAWQRILRGFSVLKQESKSYPKLAVSSTAFPAVYEDTIIQTCFIHSLGPLTEFKECS